MTTAFLGDWLVSEYVYTPAGEYVGVVRQRRRLQPLAADKIRVIQICEVMETAVSLSAKGEQVAAMMNQRVGEFVFDLQLAGRARHYLGPDVIGGGFSWRDGALTARGLWPRFGYNFTSFSILLRPERQVTGGKFFVANEEVATIVGTAVPQAQGYPEMAGAAPTADGRPRTPFEHGHYRGYRYGIAPDGELLETVEIMIENRTQINTDEHRSGKNPCSSVKIRVPFLSDMNAAPGREKWYGPLRELEAVTAPGETLSLLEIYDQASGFIAGLGRRFRDEKLCGVELYVLTADHGNLAADRRLQTAEDDRPTNISGQSPAVEGQRTTP